MGVLTQKAQVTIPLSIREQVGLRPGDAVEFEIKNETIILHKKVRSDSIQKYKGYLGNESTDAALAELR